MLMTTIDRSRPAARPTLAIALAAALTGFTGVHGSAQTPAGSAGQKPAAAAQTPPATAKPPVTSKPNTPTTPPSGSAAQPSGAKPPQLQQGPAPPADYVIGPDDALEIVYWREKDLSAAVVVRPDGKIALPLINDIQAAGLTPDQLREQVQKAASRFVTDPTVTVVVKQINSRRVFVTGSVNKPGPYPLNDNMTVLQMLALAGGLTEFANDKKILIMRTERGTTQSYKFNYRDVREGKALNSNILLKPGDTIVVP